MAFARRLIKYVISPMGYNALILEIAGGMRFDSHPIITEKWLEAIENATYIHKHSHNMYYSLKKDIIRLPKCPAPQNRFKPNVVKGEEYAFIREHIRKFNKYINQ